MIPIYPVNEESIGHITGRMVCVVTSRGERFIGRVAGCRNDKLVLFDDEDESPFSSPSHEHHHEDPKHEEEHHEKHKKHHKKGKKHHRDHKPHKHKKHKDDKKCSCRIAKTSSSFPNHDNRRRFFEIDLALISFLFLLVL
ncbi:hypothetical protein [Paenibacillus terrigena]|uniref:hypothetical protein n=1 Tax=Paenibacillus terrigena TaxID=369333 RepID=UPI0028D111C4|nr:hypothetical protein [Paenibacillus terrigena]